MKLVQEILLLFNNCQRLEQADTLSDSSTAWKVVGYRLLCSHLKISNSVSSEINSYLYIQQYFSFLMFLKRTFTFFMSILTFVNNAFILLLFRICIFGCVFICCTLLIFQLSVLLIFFLQ